MSILSFSKYLEFMELIEAVERGVAGREEMWTKLVRWLAREHIAYLEYENRELRYEGERWRHRCEGAMDALRIFERKHRWLEESVMEAALLNPMPPLIIPKRQP